MLKVYEKYLSLSITHKNRTSPGHMPRTRTNTLPTTPFSSHGYSVSFPTRCTSVSRSLSMRNFWCLCTRSVTSLVVPLKNSTMTSGASCHSTVQVSTSLRHPCLNTSVPQNMRQSCRSISISTTSKFVPPHNNCKPIWPPNSKTWQAN